MRALDLHWLAEQSDWRSALKAIDANDPASWQRVCTLANARLDFTSTINFDRAAQRLLGLAPPSALDTKPIRLAFFSTSTIDHLLPAMRVAALRRGLHLTLNVGDYGQYLQELNDRASSFYTFKPNAALFAFDATSLLGASGADQSAAASRERIDAVIERLRRIWGLAAAGCGGQVIQQTVMPTCLPLIGNNEHRLAASHRGMIDQLNHRLRESADAEGVDILALDSRIADDGLYSWHSPVLWHRAKQEISPAAAPLYGELVARLLSAQQGRSKKCLVLDLDNTLWGGVIGDDGLGGIVLGQGNALGEAFVAFQSYAKELSRRGIILAVCSKNDEANALEPFEKHPDMVLRRDDIACFVANWEAKPDNLRSIAKTLNIGIDSLVFVDDNPYERNIVRRELPMVAVPELSDDPADYARSLADAGYFEALRITDDDLERSNQYQGNLKREVLRESATDLPSYLKSLDMKLVWRPFDKVDLQRVVQLINKTNQFNLTTQRYSDADVLAMMSDPDWFTLQARLTDTFGDNGIIAIVIGKRAEPGSSDILIDTWLMSCRVLGRQVEEATMNLIVDQAAKLGGAHVIGQYRPTAKNGMVRDLYSRLGFAKVSPEDQDNTLWRRPVSGYTPYETFIEIKDPAT